MQNQKNNSITQGGEVSGNPTGSKVVTLEAILQQAEQRTKERYLEAIERFLEEDNLAKSSEALSNLFHTWIREANEAGCEQDRIDMSHRIQPLQALILDLNEGYRHSLECMKFEIDLKIKGQLVNIPDYWKDQDQRQHNQKSNL